MDAESEAKSETAAPAQPFGIDMSGSSGSYELVLSGVIFGLVGWWLDRRLGTSPLLVIVFSILGVTGACLSIYYRYKHQIAQIQAETAALKAKSRR